MNQPKTLRPDGRALRQAGFSLVELMIAMTMGLLIVLALATLLINVNRNNTEMSRTNSVIENGRFSMQILETDLTHAGFWGGYVPEYDDLSRTTVATAALSLPTVQGNGAVPVTTNPALDTSVVPNPCLTYSAANWNAAYQYQMIGIPVQVYEVSAAGVAPTVGTCAAATYFPNPQPKTHVLVVRHAAPCAASATATDEDCTMQSGAAYFQYGRCNTTVAPYFLFAAAADATLSNFTLANRAPTDICGATAEAYKFVSHIYHVRNYSTTVGDGIPTLMRSTFRVVGGVLKFDSSDALVEGVEAFRVELGIDNVSKSGLALATSNFQAVIDWASTTNQKTPNNRGDGTPDAFKQCPSATSTPTVAACSAFDLMNTVSVKLHLLVRANTTTPGYTDGKTYTLGDTAAGGITLTPGGNYKRHLYTQAVRLANISMRREVPPN